MYIAIREETEEKTFTRNGEREKYKDMERDWDEIMNNIYKYGKIWK